MRLGGLARSSAVGSVIAVVLALVWSVWRRLSDGAPPLALFFAAMLALLVALGFAASGLIGQLAGARPVAGLAVAAALAWLLITLL